MANNEMQLASGRLSERQPLPCLETCLAASLTCCDRIALKGRPPKLRLHQVSKVFEVVEIEERLSACSQAGMHARTLCPTHACHSRLCDVSTASARFAFLFPSLSPPRPSSPAEGN
jgi:hypothetical protein